MLTTKNFVVSAILYPGNIEIFYLFFVIYIMIIIMYARVIVFKPIWFHLQWYPREWCHWCLEFYLNHLGNIGLPMQTEAMILSSICNTYTFLKQEKNYSSLNIFMILSHFALKNINHSMIYVTFFPKKIYNHLFNLKPVRISLWE